MINVNAPTNQKILEKVRKACKRDSCLSSMTDEQAIQFYKQLKKLIASGTANPYSRMTDYVQSWGLGGGVEEGTLRQMIWTLGRRLFGGVKAVQTRFKIKEVVAPMRKSEHAIAETERLKRYRIKQKFDPLQESIHASIAFREEFEYWREEARKTGVEKPYVSKMAGRWLESLQHTVELFKSLKLIDDKALEDIRDKISIGTLQQIIINQGGDGNAGMPRPGGLLDAFVHNVGQLAIDSNGQQSINQELHETGIRPADCQFGSSDSALVEAGEGAGIESVGIEDYRELPAEPTPRDDESDTP